MMDQSDSQILFTELQNEVSSACEDSTEEEIERSAKHLEAVNYFPTLVWPVSNFLRMKKADILDSLSSVASASDEELMSLSAAKDADESERFREDQMRLIVYHFLLLERLRSSDPEAWDEIHELCQED